MSMLADECKLCGRPDRTPMPSYGKHPGFGYFNVRGEIDAEPGVEYMSFGILIYVCRLCMADLEATVRDYIQAMQKERDEKRQIKSELGGSQNECGEYAP